MNIIKELVLGFAACALIVSLAIASNAALDRFGIGRKAQEAAQTQGTMPGSPTEPGGTACVDEKGAWRNWPWANAPTLSPRCADVTPAAQTPLETKPPTDKK